MKNLTKTKMFALVSFPGEQDLIKMNAEKKGGYWEIGGDNPCALTELGADILVVSKGKIYTLKGNRLIYQDEFSESLKYVG